MAGLMQRVDALEAAAPPSEGGPRMILLTGLGPPGDPRAPITRATVGDTELHRQPNEAEDAFIERVEKAAAAIARAPGAPVLAFGYADHEATHAQP